MNTSGVVKLFQTFQDELHLYYVMELVQGGELFARSAASLLAFKIFRDSTSSTWSWSWSSSYLSHFSYFLSSSKSVRSQDYLRKIDVASEKQARFFTAEAIFRGVV